MGAFATHTSWAIGPLFLLNVIAGLAIGAVHLAWRHWLSAAECAAHAFGLAVAVLLRQAIRERVA